MSPPVSSTIVRTVLRVVPGPRSARARILTVAALATALASAGRRLWLARAARRFAAVRGPRFERPAVALLPVVAGDGVASAPASSARAATSGRPAPGLHGPDVVDGTVASDAPDAPDAPTGSPS